MSRKMLVMLAVFVVLCLFASCVFDSNRLSDGNNMVKPSEENDGMVDYRDLTNENGVLLNETGRRVVAVTLKNSAIKIGRAVLEEHFPEYFLDNNIELDAIEEDGIWTVYNVLETEGVTDDGKIWIAKDGGYYVQMRKSNGEIISIQFDG